MTSIGFVIAIIGFVVGIVGESNFDRTVAGIGGWLIIAGGFGMLVGVAIKLWEIMP